MIELKTLSKKSPEFISYLTGTFSKTLRALPVQSLNVNSSAETVTFKIVPIDSIERPSTVVFIAQMFKVRSFLLVLVPLFLVLTKNIDDKTLSSVWYTIAASIGVLCAFTAVNLRNDYMDHISGVDRILERSGSRAIQNGWVSAEKVKHLSTFFLVIAMLLSVPIVFVFPSVSWIIVISLAIGLWAQFMKSQSFKYRVGGEIALFLMFGPLLTVGYQLAMGISFDEESFWLGCVWGWLVMFIIHLRNFENILPSAQAGFTNTVNWLGFDRSRRLLAAWWIIFMILNFAYHMVYAGSYWAIYLTIVLALFSFSFIARLKSISSPIGSELRVVFKRGFSLFLITISLWVFECIWYILD